MDQRRFFLFLTLCFLIMLVFGPKQPPKPKPNEGAAALPVQQAAEPVGEGENPKPDAPPAAGEDQPDNADNLADLEQAPAELEYVTLGSVDSDSPYRLLVTLTNKGAGVRRIELSSPRFRDLHDRGGYLGHLELTPAAEGGLRVQAVGGGTPAATAGIEVGDRLLSATVKQEPQPLLTARSLAKLLERQKPGQKFTLQVARGDAAPADYEITLARRPLEVIRPEAENVLLREEKLPAGVTSPPSFQFTFEQLGEARLQTLEEVEQAILAAAQAGNPAPEIATELAGLDLRDGNWEIADRDETSVTFRKTAPQYNVEVLKRYRLQQVLEQSLDDKNFPAYSLKLEIEVRNLGSGDLPLRYRLDGPNGLPIEGWWYANKVGRKMTVGIRDVIIRHVEKDAPEQFNPAMIAEGDAGVVEGRPLAYAGVDAQYFSAVLIPQKPSLDTEWVDQLRFISLSPPPKKRAHEGRYVNATCRLISHPLVIAPNESLTHSYEIFAGPKRPDLLKNYQAEESPQYTLDDLVYYGWFGAVAKPMLWILHTFYGWVGNYGIAIIMLTVLVRGCMFPLSRKQTQSMAKMQALKPEMDKIKEKYKQDMQKQSQATQELYRKHNINPLAGCLPLFIQMPIFLGLYRALMVDVELRQAPLLGDSIRWCSNLAAPDMFYDWSWFMPESVNNGTAPLIFGLGPYLNILPLVTAGLFLLQQKIFMPEPANEQAAMQQKIMKYMMLFMGFLFFKVAAGLCLYFIASSIWGIVERKLLPKPEPTNQLATADGPAPSEGPTRRTGAEVAAAKRKKAKKKKR